jgi:hypothetical protein
MKLGIGSAERRVAAFVAGFLGVCFPLFAQTYRPDLYSAVNNSLLRFPSLTLSDAQLFGFSTAFNHMETTTPDFLPALALSTTTPQRTAAASRATDPKDLSKGSEAVEVKRNLLDYVHGEVGFLYGRSTGRVSGNTEAGYIIGDVGDDKFHITAGASYENSDLRWRRR